MDRMISFDANHFTGASLCSLSMNYRKHCVGFDSVKAQTKITTEFREDLVKARITAKVGSHFECYHITEYFEGLQSLSKSKLSTNVDAAVYGTVKGSTIRWTPTKAKIKNQNSLGG
ncbi:hypothetical protein PROFUN_15970 [Planoprotostelium fungivorum]|uniref:Uncharacterized protein n=1 Tax=Planoprotostelium fungivorum TaxID=1890364 RepID=A0A2P6MU01_9EUKA|nr:hypothetical protein PROFUN_15970 [Planoprotostelium fungivorum]